MAELPRVPILLLGDAGVGKSTFLSRLTLGAEAASTPSLTLAPLKDLDQPFAFDVRLFNRPYRFEFYDTASPQNYTLLRPQVVILCFSIANPASLESVHTFWKGIVEQHFNLDDNLPVILLGLGRDVRGRDDYAGRVKTMVSDEENEAPSSQQGEATTLLRESRGRTFLYPQEGVRVAQEMRCDRYCECSALTGELCAEVFEDIARTAAMTTTSKGGKSDEWSCAIM